MCKKNIILLRLNKKTNGRLKLEEKLIKTRKDFNMSKQLLEIKDLFVTAGEKEILKGINLTVNKGETHVIMGPNGSRKNHNRKCHFK